jgi:hypothetical protein
MIEMVVFDVFADTTDPMDYLKHGTINGTSLISLTDFGCVCFGDVCACDRDRAVRLSTRLHRLPPLLNSTK